MALTLLENANLINPETGTEKKGSLLIENGFIKEIGAKIKVPAASFKTIDCEGKCLAPGIIDIGVKVCEPGERHKESYNSAGKAAAAGGVTTIVTRPDTVPVIDTPETLEFIRRRANESAPIHVLPLAALTKRREGQKMTEIGFLQDAGAVGFTDCDKVVLDTKILSRVLTYAKSLGALVIGHPQDPYLSNKAAITSGKFASLRGLRSVSPIAEKIGLDRDLSLIEMTGVAYHFDQITTACALQSLIKAKTDGLDITAGTSIHHLTLNEFDVGDYRTFFKIKPPLRSEEDRISIIQALNDGTIDIISSMHTPQDEESKRLPFEEAASGAVGLETLLPAALRLYHAQMLDLPTLFRVMSLNPAKRLGLPAGRLKAGAPADLVLFDPNKPFVLNRFELLSKSKNTPFDEARMQGKVHRTFVGGIEVFAQ